MKSLILNELPEIRNGEPVIPVISMYRPWANWVALGWKTIETRLSPRLRCLSGRRIGIHAGLKWDNNWEKSAREFLSGFQIIQTRYFVNTGGEIICTAFAEYIGRLATEEANGALIECQTYRYGLRLSEIEIIEAIPCKGRQGVFYVNYPQTGQ